MSKNYKNLAKGVRERLNPENISFQKSLNEDLSTISYSDLLVYVRLAMNAVPPDYTAKSKEAGEMVKSHLSKELVDVATGVDDSFDKVDTHIKGASDIDLLVITNKYYRIAWVKLNNILNDFALKQKYYQSQIAKLERETTISNYQGNALEDLRQLRLDSEIILRKIYNRGDVSFPFLSISKINDKSSMTNGRLKKMIRFLKNIKEDSNHDIDLNSFEINAICYDINIDKYEDKSF